MWNEAQTLEQHLRAILRGAAKILGCNSTNLVLIDDEANEVRVEVGATANEAPILDEVQRILGESFAGITLRLDTVSDSMLIRAWRDRTCYETSSLAELVGGAFPTETTSRVAALIGAHRFIAVPALSSRRNYGVILFEKTGSYPFSCQQREVLLRYARRIGEILESDLSGKRRRLFAQRPDGGGPEQLERLLLQLSLGEPAPALLLDPELRITSCNESATQLLGYAADELYERPVASLLGEPQLLDVLSDEILDPSNPSAEQPTSVIRPDGALSPVRVEALLLADEMGRTVGFLLVIRPDDGRRASEDPSAEHLLDRSRIETMGEIAAQMAHEVRNPLLAIGATLEGLASEPLAETHRCQVEAMIAEISRIDSILKGYLGGRQELALTRVRLVDVVNDARRLLQGARKIDGATIAVDIDPQLTVRADHDALRQVVFNLLLNALEASPPGATVSCHGTVADRQLTLCIDDQGPGLPAGREDCFRKFFTTKDSGTGLGLPVSQQIARAHGGDVDLRDHPDGGCRATLVLPKWDVSTEPSEAA